MKPVRLVLGLLLLVGVYFLNFNQRLYHLAIKSDEVFFGTTALIILLVFVAVVLIVTGIMEGESEDDQFPLGRNRR